MLQRLLASIDPNPQAMLNFKVRKALNRLRTNGRLEESPVSYYEELVMQVQFDEPFKEKFSKNWPPEAEKEPGRAVPAKIVTGLIHDATADVLTRADELKWKLPQDDDDLRELVKRYLDDRIKAATCESLAGYLNSELARQNNRESLRRA